MSNQLFEQLISGKRIPLTESQLAQFQIYCSAQDLSLQKWISISLIIFEQKRQYCLHFLLYIYKNQLSKSNYRDFIHQDNKVRIYSYIIVLLLTKATKQTTKAQVDRLGSEVEKYLIQCERVKMASNDICRAFSQYYDGNLSKSTNILNKIIETSDKIKAYDSSQNKFIAMLGLAQVYFSKRNYTKALEQYKKVFTTYKNLPTKARLGMAYSYFYLQKYQMAQACFQRVIKLDPNCVQAFIGLAIIQQKNQNFIGYFKNITNAAKINKKHPLVLIHLSQHYLIKGDLQRASKFAEEGLNQVQAMTKFITRSNRQQNEQQPFRNDYLELKARFNNILGQIEHIRNNFSQALKYYRLASNFGLSFNEIYLTQVYSHPNCQNYVQGLQVLQKLFRQSNKNQIRLLNDSLKELAYFKTKNPLKAGQQHKSYQDYYNEAIVYNKHDVQVKIQLSNHIVQTKKSRSLKLLLSAYKTLDVESSSLVKPQLLNNIGVLLIQNQEYSQACSFLNLCVNKLKSISDKLPKIQQEHAKNDQQVKTQNNTQSQEDQNVKINANYLIALYNSAIAKEKMCLFQQSAKLYQQVIQKNKYFIDAYIRLGYVHFLQGNHKKSMNVIQDSLTHANHTEVNKFIRIDKIMNAKAAILKIWGDHVAAKDVIRQLMKTSKDLYTQIYQLSINYQTLMRKQPQTVVIKDFLRPNRQIYMRVCHQDPHNAFAYLVLAVLLLVDKRISLKQGNQLFMKLKQHASEEISIVLYNMGLFLINYDDYQSSKHILKIYRQKTNDQRGDQMMALSNFLQCKYENSIRSVKRSILLNPTNIKNRHQLIYTLQKKCQYQRNQDKNKLKQYLATHLQILKKCHKFYNFFMKLNINDYVKYQQAPDRKQETRNYGQKIRILAEERKFYVNSNIEYYQKLHRQVQAARLKQQQQKRIKNGLYRTNGEMDQNKQNQFNQIQPKDVFDESDSQEIKKRKRQEKKRKALQLAKKKQEEIDQKWTDLKEREKQEKENKKSRGTRQPKQKGSRKRQKRVKDNQSDQQSVQYRSQKSFIDQPQHSSPSHASLEDVNDEIDAPKRKRRQQRKQQRRQERRRQKRERRQRRKKIKKNRQQQLSDHDKQFSGDPFEDTPQKSARSKRNDYDDEDRSEKKKKKRQQKSEQEDDIGIDMNQYMA